MLGITSMKIIMWDMAKVEAFGINYLGSKSQAQKDSILKVKYAEVFALHHTKESQFFESLTEYKRSPTKYRALIDSLNTYASKQRDNYFNQQIEAADSTVKKPVE
jgi:hypothetical protein